MKSFIALVLMGLTSLAFADELPCTELTARIERGFRVQVAITATDLVDSTQHWEKTSELFLVPTIVNSHCDENSANRYYIADRPVTIVLHHGQVAGFVDGEFIYNGSALKMSSLMVHNAVTASVISRWGFDTFEGIDRTPYTSVLQIPTYETLPYSTPFSTVLGVAGKDSQLWQVSAKYTIDLPAVTP